MALDDFQMPSFQDPDGTKYVWDSASQSYVKTPLTDNRPDQSHATGGDNDLFDPFQHTEMSSSPTTEGYMAKSAGWDDETGVPGHSFYYLDCPFCGSDKDYRESRLPGTSGGKLYLCNQCGKYSDPNMTARSEGDFQDPNDPRLGSFENDPPFAQPDEVKCPNCGEVTTEQACPACKKDLTPEWNTHGQSNEFFDVHPDFNDANEFWTWPQNVPKKNELNYDDSFPSMSLSKVSADVFNQLREWNQQHSNPAAQLGQACAVAAFNPDTRDEAERVYNAWKANPDFTESWNEALDWAGHPQMPWETKQMYLQEFQQLRQALGSVKAKLAGASLWNDIFSDSIPMRTEVAKWIMDTRGQLHLEHGMEANHAPLAERAGLGPTDQVALGSVYNDGTADVQKVFSQDVLDLDHIQQELQRELGPIQLQPPTGLGSFAEKGEVFVPFDIMGGQWFVPPHAQMITGLAWVRERSNGVEYQPNMILVVEHLRDEDYSLWAQGASAIVTALGGAGSHAAYLAMTSNIPVIVGIGDSYNKLETGNYVKIDPQNEVIMVAPGATGATPPDQKQQIWDGMLQYQRQRGGSVRQFAHVIEELDWKAANSPNLEECPECSAPMIDQGGDSVCHDCGHKQPIIVQAGALAIPAAEALGGEAAGAAAGGSAGGGMAGIGGLMTKALRPGFGMGFMMGRGHGGDTTVNVNNGAGGGGASGVPFDPSAGTVSHVHQKYAAWDMQHHAFLSELWAWLQNALKGAGGVLAANPVDDALLAGLSGSMGAAHQQINNQLQQTTAALGDDNVGLATKNDGTNSTEDASDSGIEGKKEQGDGPEQLKDVDGGHDSQDSAAGDNLGDPHLQDKALKAFHMNLPLVIEFADSEEPGSENPILAALDAMLEEAFPGYKDAFDTEAGATTEHPQESESETPEERDEDVDKPDAKSEGSDKKESARIASVWHFAGDPWAGALTPDDNKAWERGNIPAGAGGPAMQICPRCGQAHPEGTPCPVADVTTPLTTGDPTAQAAPATHVITKWRLAMPSNMPAGVPQQQAGAPAAPTTCPTCGCSHLPGTPCPTPDMSQMQAPAAGSSNLVSPPVGPGVSYSSIGNHFALFGETDGGEEDTETSRKHNDDHHDNSYEDGDDGGYHSEDDWVDDSGQPLQEGAEYEMSSPASPIPDRVTIVQILPEKLTYRLHSGDIDFDDTITRDQLDLDGISFSPVDFDDTGEDSMDTFPGEEMPVRPGQDALPQQNDLSSPSTVMSHFEPVSLDTYTGSFQGDKVMDRSWLIEDSSPVEVDPTLMAKFAGKDFSPREQREFIDETGEARNLDRLDLSGTHYIDDDLHTNDTLW